MLVGTCPSNEQSTNKKNEQAIPPQSYWRATKVENPTMNRQLYEWVAKCKRNLDNEREQSNNPILFSNVSVSVLQ
jgi:hypothetical protein